MTIEFEAPALPAWQTQYLNEPHRAQRRASLFEYARRTYAGKRKPWLKRMRFLLRALGQYRLHDVWLRLLEAPGLQPMIARQPLLAAKLQHRYVLSGLDTARRLGVACGHFDAFLRRVPRLLNATIYSASGLHLTAIATTASAYELRLLHLPHCWQEGEVSLGLFEQDALIGAVTFVLGDAGEFAPDLARGESALMIGGIQGCQSDDGQDAFRRATKTMHGLRPFSLLLHAARAVARGLGATRLIAVADTGHALRYKRGKGRIRLSYDAIWLDHGATAVDANVFDLGLATASKDLADVPSQKRAQYRRRYALMESVDADIRAVLAPCG
ncbi:MAG: DUF535 family protein [Proteobacteria bacterium]|uniref:VirK/YbjX family protein n=1 Tax=Rudaea sp. TaxID=2136325 RepID=UPI00321FAFCC|nr:DUF535 family protein [Pseudomonadota bacterium]